MDKIIKTNNNFDERIPWIDFARGLTMFFVIWSHTLLYRNIPGKYLTAGYIGVFFFITGYLMQNKKISKKTGIIIIKKQVKKLLIPYTLVSIILILISGFWSYIANGYIIKQDIINFFGMFYGRLFLSIRQDMPQIVFLGASNAALWFLPAMFLSSLLYLVLRITKFPYIIFLISIFICCGIVFTFSPVLLPWSLDTAPIFAVVMFSAKLYQNYEKLSSKLRKIFLIPITLIYIACVDFGGGKSFIKYLWLKRYCQCNPIYVNCHSRIYSHSGS